MSAARRPAVAGNWKMHKTAAEAREFLAAFIPLVEPYMGRVDVGVCPPFTALEACASAVEGTRVGVFAQNVHEADAGAHTGEVSTGMVLAAGAHGSLIGHSERRAAGETDAQVAARVRAVLDAGMVAILCVGESLAQREAGETDAWVAGQVRSALAGVTAEEQWRLVVAYEPIWAIGTGLTATPEQAQDACALVRRVAGEGIDGDLLQVLYGGSVSPANAAELMSQPDVDGALVGGASLDPESLAQIVAAAG
jgi:triosephosphate isomerase